MALISMTGFARADGELNGAHWYWEVKTVNGKGLDVRCRMPSGFESIEQAVRGAVARHVKRGNCQLVLQVSRDRSMSELRVNQDALNQAVALMESLKTSIDATPPTLDGLLSIKGVLELAEPEESDEARQALNEAVLENLEIALTDLETMRSEEGQKLAALLSDQISQIEKLAIAARDCPARTVEAIRSRLIQQVQRLQDAVPVMDPDRLHQEAVILSAKADIQEELDRLFAHIDAARDLMASDEPAGRKFDFLTQEFNRESNTLCSKSNDQALTAIGLELKAVVDQVREQVQNIE